MRDYSYQLAFMDPRKQWAPVHIIGMGAVGSEAFSSMLGLGMRDVTIYDPERVEKLELPAQRIYRPSDIGRSKVFAALEWAMRQEYPASQVKARPEKVDESNCFSGIVISTVGSKESRWGVWQAVVESGKDIDLFFDCELKGEYVWLNALAPYVEHEAKGYENTLLCGRELPEPSGGAKIFPGASKMIAGAIEQMIVGYYRNGVLPTSTKRTCSCSVREFANDLTNVRRVGEEERDVLPY